MTFKLTMTVDYLGRPYGFITKDGERVWEDRSWTIEESEIAKGHAAAKLQELVYEDRAQRMFHGLLAFYTAADTVQCYHDDERVNSAVKDLRGTVYQAIGDDIVDELRTEMMKSGNVEKRLE